MIDALPTAYEHATPKARKPHKCVECRGVIPAGEVYHRHSGIWDGEPARYVECADCHAMRNAVDEIITDCWDKTPFEGLCEYIFEGSDKDLMRRWVENCDKRGATVSQWMRDGLDDSRNQNNGPY